MSVVDAFVTNDVLGGESYDASRLSSLVMASSVASHPFFERFAAVELTASQLRVFAIQWFKAASLHKRAFPALIWNTVRDDVRFGLIDILYEEYGSGDQNTVHAYLLRRFLNALGVTDADVETTMTLPEITRFADLVLTAWLCPSPAKAFGCHYALEVVATRLHTAFADSLLRRSDLPSDALEYFRVHRQAEPRHVSCSDVGLVAYWQSPVERQEVLDGVAIGADALGILLDGLNRSLFESAA